MLSITPVVHGILPDAGPGDATCGWGVTPIRQRYKTASLSIFLGIEQKEGTISSEGFTGLAGWFGGLPRSVDNGSHNELR